MGKCLSCCRSNDFQDNQNSNFPSKAIQLNSTFGSKTEDFPTTLGTVIETVTDPPTKISNQRDTFIETNGDYFGKPTTLATSGEKRFPPSIKSFRAKSESNKSFSHHQHSSKKEREYSDSKINALFDRYKDSKEDLILSEGIETFCCDLEVKPEEFLVLLLAWKFSASQMCCFTREEFQRGCRKLRVDSIIGIQSTFYELTEEAKDFEKFKDLYRFTYMFGLEVGQRILPAEMAVQLWKLVFSQREPPILGRWLTFLCKHPQVKGIPRDTWNMFLNFTDAVGNDLSNYDDMEAWPCLFDDFVEYENDRANQNFHLSKEKIERDI